MSAGSADALVADRDSYSCSLVSTCDDGSGDGDNGQRRRRRGALGSEGGRAGGGASRDLERKGKSEVRTQMLARGLDSKASKGCGSDRGATLRMFRSGGTTTTHTHPTPARPSRDAYSPRPTKRKMTCENRSQVLFGTIGREACARLRWAFTRVCVFVLCADTQCFVYVSSRRGAPAPLRKQ